MTTPDIEVVLEAAKLHGEDSDPDHEVGDLQDFARLCWKRLTPDQKREAFEEYFSDHE
jgi:hypothetical protein